VALVSQSGGMSSELAVALTERHVGLSYVISSGNEAGLTVEDYLGFLVREPGVRAIALIAESFKQPGLLLEVLAQAADAGIPLVVLRIGRSTQGQRQAASHTGALAGDDRVIDAVMRDWGVSQVATMGDLLETVVCFAVNQKPVRSRVAFVSGSGGLAGLLADMSSDVQLELAQVSARTAGSLSQLLPDFATVSNPLDVTGPTYQHNETYAGVLTTLAADADVGVLGVYQNASNVDAPSLRQAGRNLRLAHVAEGVAEQCEKPLIAFTNSGSEVIDPQIPAILHAVGVPLLYGADRAVRAADCTNPRSIA
jgi:acyl-CoA synthetase (NDP forming)